MEDAGSTRPGGRGTTSSPAELSRVLVSREVRRLIQTGGRPDEMLRVALGEGLRTLRQDGIDKVWAGTTTIEEVLRTDDAMRIAYQHRKEQERDEGGL